MRNSQLRAVAPSLVLKKNSVLKKYPSRVSTLRTRLPLATITLCTSLCFHQAVSRSCHAKTTGKASSALQYQYPPLLLKATSPVKEALPESLLPKTPKVAASSHSTADALEPRVLQQPGTMQTPWWKATCLLEKYSATPYFVRKHFKS